MNGSPPCFPQSHAANPNCPGEAVRPPTGEGRPTTPGPCTRAEGPSARRPAGDRSGRLGETGGVGSRYPDALG